MPGIRDDKDAEHGETAIGIIARGRKLLPPRIRIGPGPGFLYAAEASAARTVLDAKRGRRAAGLIEAHATLAAFRSYRALYGNSFRGDFEALLGDLNQFWICRFREGCPVPEWIEPEEDEQAPATSEDKPAPPRPSQSLGKDGRKYEARNSLERINDEASDEGIQ